MTPKDLLAPTYLQFLAALLGWLDKAAKQNPNGGIDELLSARIAPDMLPLSTQIRFTCVQALEGLYRLKSEPFPPLVQELLEEGRNAADHPGTLSSAKARIEETIAIVESFSEKQFDTDFKRPIEHALPTGMIFDLTTEQYVRDWALGQFYFHLMIAYAILRNQGVDLGKADYVAHMFAYLRPGTTPA